MVCFKELEFDKVIGILSSDISLLLIEAKEIVKKTKAFSYKGVRDERLAVFGVAGLIQRQMEIYTMMNNKSEKKC